MRKTFYGAACERGAGPELERYTFNTAREAQEWIDHQRDVRGDPTKWVVVRISPTKARP